MIDATASSKNLYKNFSNVDYSSPGKYLENAYGKKTIYYTRDDFLNERKKKNIYKASAIITTVATIGVIGFTLIKGGLDIEKFKMLGEKGRAILGKVSNGMTNFINIKDDYWDKFINSKRLEKIYGFPILKGIANKATWFYKSIAKSVFKSDYTKAYEKVKKLGGEAIDIQDYDKFFKSIDNATYNALHKKGERVTDKLLNRNLIHRFFNTAIANEKILQSEGSIIESIPTNSNLSNECNLAIEEFNNVRDKIFKKLCPKMRDINCGSAPTDLLTIVTAMGGLGVSTATADSKEERKSTLINLGIPLITTLAGTTYGNLKMYSGTKSLLFSLIIGQLASRTAKAIDKHVKEKNKNSAT